MVIAHFFSPEMTLDILKEAPFIAYGILFYVTAPCAHLTDICHFLKSYIRQVDHNSRQIS
jgi:hypothetical protein